MYLVGPDTAFSKQNTTCSCRYAPILSFWVSQWRSSSNSNVAGNGSLTTTTFSTGSLTYYGALVKLVHEISVYRYFIRDGCGDENGLYLDSWRIWPILRPGGERDRTARRWIILYACSCLFIQARTPTHESWMETIQSVRIRKRTLVCFCVCVCVQIQIFSKYASFDAIDSFWQILMT